MAKKRKGETEEDFSLIIVGSILLNALILLFLIYAFFGHQIVLPMWGLGVYLFLIVISILAIVRGYLISNEGYIVPSALDISFQATGGIIILEVIILALIKGGIVLFSQ